MMHGHDDVATTRAYSEMVFVFIVEVLMAKSPKEKILNLPLNNQDMIHAEKQIDIMFNGTNHNQVLFMGIKIEDFTREYLLKLLYIYGERFMEDNV